MLSAPGRQRVRGGGAAVASGAVPLGRPVRTFSLEEVSQRVDALALTVASRASASVLLLGCVVVILFGAQSLLATMEQMDTDIKEMNEQMAIANGGLVILNKTMDSVPPTAQHIEAIVKSVKVTEGQVQRSVVAIDSMSTTTAQLNGQLSAIAGSTTDMHASLDSASASTEQLATTIDALNADITPLVRTQHAMLLGTRRMRGGVDSMNASLAYVIRIMNYIAAPPTGGGMTIRADLPKSTLPPIPGIRAEVAPVPVFPRDIWPVYTGP